MNKSLIVLLWVSWLLLIVIDRADAYLDPGSGSMMLQLLLGGAAGVAVITKLYWRRFLSLFGISERKKPDPSGESPQIPTQPELANNSTRQR